MPRASEHPDTGIVSASPIGFAPKPVPQVQITAPTYQDIAVDTKWTPADSLMRFVAGSNWTVDYYSQLIDTDTPLTAQSVTVSAAYQQYNRICGLVLKVKTPLTPQQDDVTKMMEADGEAYMFVPNGGLIPNEGDNFTADVGVGKPMIFRVSATQKLTWQKQAVYLITYALVSTEQAYVDDLVAKTINDAVYNDEFLTMGKNPIVQASDAQTLAELEVVIHRLTTQYFSFFFNPEFQTLTIANQSTWVYDPFVVDFLSKTMNPQDSPFIQKMRVLNVTDDVAMCQDNFWTALLENDPSYLQTGFTQVGLVYTGEFTNSPWNNGIRFTGIDACVYPLNPKVGALGLNPYRIKTLVTEPIQSPANDAYLAWWNTEYDVTPGTYTTAPISGPVLADPSSPTPVNDMYPPVNLAGATIGQQVGTPVPFFPVLYDQYYVLSANFYNKTSLQSVLEQVVWRYLSGEALDPVQLSETAGLVQQWGVLESFYYVPILIWLIRSYIRRFQR